MKTRTESRAIACRKWRTVLLLPCAFVICTRELLDRCLYAETPAEWGREALFISTWPRSVGLTNSNYRKPNSQQLSCFSEKAKRTLSSDYYISSDVSSFILSHINLMHLGATTINANQCNLTKNECFYYACLMTLLSVMTFVCNSTRLVYHHVLVDTQTFLV